MFWLADVFNGSYSQEEVRRIEKWARRQRADAVHGLLSALGHGAAQTFKTTGRGAKAVYAGFAALGGKLDRWNRKQATIRELNALSDRTLKDIGLHRGEIPSVVEEIVSGERQRRMPGHSKTVQGVLKETNVVSSIDVQEAANEWQRAA